MDLFVDEMRFQNGDGDYLDDCYQAIPQDKDNARGTASTRYLNVSKSNSQSKPLPALYSSSQECCGCSACYAICSLSGTNNDSKRMIKMWSPMGGGQMISFPLTGAITMLPDAEGFLYPVVDASICVRCYQCVKSCAFKEFEKQNSIKE